ncbi:hypothetical protein C6P40_000977 [Pichia californica]|uniref:Major facilitator superfamily (MFS) profile domain-containing protein n=1 Tax=Pichia californica TaxID=460514 RepID=A0A9P7BG92_9ASCO|nr:hypothetical protein C6P42_000314 [[Candida] californica]KAG0688459.1 hypothetical protein C6P40_000977 [[Candida] californica]
MEVTSSSSILRKNDYKIETEPIDSFNPIDQAAEKRLVHKFDWRLMPMFATMYFFSSLDRSNIGNAKVAGMTADLGISDVQYSNVVSVLYATYLPVMLPGVWFMKRCKKPRYYMAGMMFCWSLCSLFTLFAKSYGSLIALRLLIGLFEGSYFSCIAVITTDYYLPVELGRRTAYFFASSSLASAFGGLIATGITKITSGNLKSWQYIFLIEGILSCIAVAWLFFGLPDSPDQLIKTDEEREVYKDRERRRILYTDTNGFEFKEVLAACTDYKTSFSVVIQFTQDICLYGFSTFLPIILKSGLKFNSLQAQYLSVPVYLLAGIIFLIAAEISDRKKIRGPIIAFTNIFGITGYILLLAVKNNAVKYFACYLICFSIYTGTGINESWLASNTSPRFKRYTAIGLNQTLGNVSGAISPQVYRKSPDYVLGHAFTLGCLIVSSICSLICSWLLHKRNLHNEKVMETGVDDRNRKRDYGDDSPEFRFII